MWAEKEMVGKFLCPDRRKAKQLLCQDIREAVGMGFPLNPACFHPTTAGGFTAGPQGGRPELCSKSEGP